MINEEQLNSLIRRLEDSNKKAIEEANRKQSEYLQQNIKKDIHKLKEEFEEKLNKKSAEFENKYKELKIKYEKLEKELRKNNIIIFGLENTAENLENFIVNELNQRLDLSLTLSDINNVYTIGKQSTKRPIIIKLVSYINKQKILRKSKTLKGTGISIAEELTVEERRENKILRQHLRNARSQHLNAYIKNRKLIINGQEYTVRNLIEEEYNTDTEDTEDKEKEDRDLYEAKQAATRFNNSDPPTPTTEGIQFDTNTQENDVFVLNKELGPKRKFPKNQPINKIIRTSNRLISNKEQNKNSTSDNTPQK